MIHHLIRRIALVVLPAAVLAGCANGAEAPSSERVSLYKYDGARQCEGPGTPLQATELQLAAAGIRVLAASCGTDGLAHMAVCGGSSGSIHIVEVSQAQAKAALELGFAPLAKLPDASRRACP